MSTDLKARIAAHYYNLGCQAAMQTKTSSAKDVARSLGHISSHALPSIGGIGGLAGGGYLGLHMGADFAKAIAEQAAREGDHFGSLAASLLGTPALAGAGLGIGGLIGGLGGSQLGRGAKEVALEALRKKPNNRLYLL